MCPTRLKQCAHTPYESILQEQGSNDPRRSRCGAARLLVFGENVKRVAGGGAQLRGAGPLQQQFTQSQPASWAVTRRTPHEPGRHAILTCRRGATRMIDISLVRGAPAFILP